MSAPEKALEPDGARMSANRGQVLLEINNAIASHLELAPLLKAISECLRRELPHDFAGLAIYDPEIRQLRSHGLNFEAGAQHFAVGQVVPIEGTPAGLIFTSGRPLLLDRLDPDRFPAELLKRGIEIGVKSGCGVPLICHGEILGTLGVASFREKAYTEADLEFLNQIGGQVAIAVENALNFEKLRKAERAVAKERDRSRLLLEVNNAVITHLNLSDLLKAVSERLSSLVSLDSTFIALRESDGIHLRTKAQFLGKLQNAKFTEGVLIPMTGTPEELVIRTGKPVLVSKVAEFEKFSSPWVRHALDVGIKSGCFVPLILGKEILGVLGITSMHEGAFRLEDVALLEQCSTQIAIAVENALNFERARQAEREVRQERDRSQLLLEINNAVVSQLELKELLKSTSASLHRIVPHDVALLALCDSTGTQLRIRALDLHKPKDGPLDEGMFFPVEGTPEGKAVRSGRPVLIKCREDMNRFSPLTVRNATAYGVRSGCTVPLIAHGRTLGSFTIVSFKEGAFTEEDAKLLVQCSQQIALAVQNAMIVSDLEKLKDRLAQEKLYLEDEIRTEFNFEEIIGQSPALRQVLQMVETVAGSDSTVLLLGETGTGKELIARAVHNHSRRKQRTFVKLNCAAIPTGLLESELFGHEKGAFTGAISQKVGRLELADQGTLFLDEVGDIPVEIQPKLLRALQEREFERLGSTYTKKVNVRLVAATNRELEKMIAAREFRSDLYYRLNVFPIRIPPLRERPDDIPLLVRYFAEKFSRQMQKPIESVPATSMAKLRAWHWPGNIRELENLIERSVILTNGSVLQVPLGELEQPVRSGGPQSSPTTLEGTEREHIIKILRETRGVLAGPNGAATRLGLKRTTLQYKMKKLGITRDHWWPASPR